MRFGILGTGVVGKTIAARLLELSHDMVMGTRDPTETLSRTEPDAYGSPPFSTWQDEKEHSLPPLPEEAFRRYDETPDEEFYRLPRFVTHIDDRATAAVTQLYREFFPAGGEILDLMSSWISHLPPEVNYHRVIGLGMNEAELRRNERLDAYVVHNLNERPQLPFGDAEFDGCGICVSIDYLTRPVEVLREVGRVLRVESPIVITFSNRCFPSKAVAVWHQLDDRGHMRLVERYLLEAGNFRKVRGLDRSPRRLFSDPLYAVVGRSTGPYTGEK